jgi:hypothetical protein
MKKPGVRKFWLKVSFCPERPKALALKIFNVELVFLDSISVQESHIQSCNYDFHVFGFK